MERPVRVGKENRKGKEELIMAYKEDIKRLIREKDRLWKVKSKVGKNPWVFLDDRNSDTSVKVKNLIQEAIDKLHEAEIILRRIRKE